MLSILFCIKSILAFISFKSDFNFLLFSSSISVLNYFKQVIVFYRCYKEYLYDLNRIEFLLFISLPIN